MRLQLTEKKEAFLGFLFFMPQINYYVSALLSSYSIQTITPYIYFFCFLAGACVIITNLKWKRCFLWGFGLLVALFLSVVMNWNVIEYMFSDSFFSSPVVWLCIIYFPIFLSFLTEVNFERLLKVTTKYSVVTLTVAATAFVNYVVVLKIVMPDYMTFAYMMVPAIFTCTISALTGTHINVFFSLMGSFLVFIGGCRGALLTIVIFFLLVFLKCFTMKGEKRTILFKIIAIIVFAIIALNFESILDSVSVVLDGMGYKSRVFASLTNSNYGGEVNSFFSGDGRNDIWKMSIENIRFIGYGLFGDRTVVRNEYNDSSYAHNWMLEMLVSFGWIIGIIAVVFVLWVVIRCLLVANKSKNIILVVMSYAVLSIIMVKHFISASFVSSIDFWFYLGVGYCITRMFNEKEEKMEGNHFE